MLKDLVVICQAFYINSLQSLFFSVFLLLFGLVWYNAATFTTKIKTKQQNKHYFKL